MKMVFNSLPWFKHPFIRITLALIAGIIAGAYFTLPIGWVCIVCGLAICLFIGFNLLPAHKKYALSWIAGMAIHLVFICIGILLLFLNTKPPKIIPHQAFSVVIEEPLSPANTSLKSMGSSAYGNIILYFQKDSTSLSIQPGHQLVLRKIPDTISAAANPGGFNFKAYAATQQLYYQVYLKNNEYYIVGKTPVAFRKRILHQLQEWILQVLNQYIVGDKEKSVAEALLIGYKKNLDKTLLQSYSSTGVVHIIAISGLHLGMIYGLLLFLLKPLKNKKYIKWLQPVCIIVVLWTFTFLTGAAPSILRSAIMFTFIVLGEQQNRRSHIYNSLAASACCILAYNPLQLWDVGFQLSYAAVISIAAFSVPITRLIYIKNKLLLNCWQLTAVNLAAQICTLPLILYYFHQFPNLFLFSNFIAVPLSGLILYLEIILLVVSPLPILAVMIGKCTSFLLLLMNSVIENTATIPFAVTEHIQINLFQTICLFGVIIIFSAGLMNKKRKYVYGSFLLIGLIALIQTISAISAARQHKLMVYYMPKKSAIDIFEGRSHRFIGDPSIYHQPLLIKNYLDPTRTLFRAANTSPQTKTIVRPPFIFSAHKKILVINPTLNLNNLSGVVPVDLVVISGNPTIHIQQLLQLFKFQTIVFDCSNPLWKIEQWKKESNDLNLHHHSIPHLGAFEMNL